VAQALTAKGGRLFAISVDPPEKSREVVERNALPFAILSDADRRTIRAYGLLHASGAPGGGDIALPAHLLVDRDGRIVFRHVARSVQDRPDPEEVRKQIESLPAGR